MFCSEKGKGTDVLDDGMRGEGRGIIYKKRGYLNALTRRYCTVIG